MTDRGASSRVIDLFDRASRRVDDGDGTVIHPVFTDADPTFLNYHAWKLRWADRQRSCDMAEAVLQHSLNSGASRAQGARRRNGLALRTLAWQARWRGAFEDAEDLAHRAVARLKGEGAPSAIADCQGVLAMVHYVRGRSDLAYECIEVGFKALEEQDNTSSRIDLLVIRAVADLTARRFQSAQQSAERAQLLSSDEERARVEHSIARVLLSDDRPGEALEMAFRSVHNCKEYRNFVVLPLALSAAAASLIDLDKLDQGEMLLLEALEIAERENDLLSTAHVKFDLARAKTRQNRLDDALALSQSGVDLTASMEFYVMHIRFLKQLASLQEKLGQTSAALQNLKALLALREVKQG